MNHFELMRLGQQSDAKILSAFSYEFWCLMNWPSSHTVQKSPVDPLASQVGIHEGPFQGWEFRLSCQVCSDGGISKVLFISDFSLARSTKYNSTLT